MIVKAKVAELAKDFPSGVDWEIRYDTTPFISESIQEVFKTLREAIILVAVVVLLFLQNWRSALIPLIAVPVAIIGTFAVMAAMGFTLNNLTLFGLVLAIGIVVDDAIVVVEAVEHHVEHGMRPYDATVRAMEEVSGPVIAIGLVLIGGIRALRVHLGDRRPVLPPVRPDDRRVDGDLGVQLPDAEPGAGRDPDQAEGPERPADGPAPGGLPGGWGVGRVPDDRAVPARPILGGGRAGAGRSARVPRPPGQRRMGRTAHGRPTRRST